MVTQLSDLDLTQTYSYADYLTWRFSELVELLKGRVLPLAAPRTDHQLISANLMVSIGTFARKHGCKVFHAPFDVRFPTNPEGKSDREIYTVVQPDISFICDLTKLDARGCIGAPDWVIEIVSPGTLDRDRSLKRVLYEEHGVGEYWIIYPREKFIDVYRRGGGREVRRTTSLCL